MTEAAREDGTVTPLRWGASPRYLKKIQGAWWQNFNKTLRSKKFPIPGWRSQDAGHFHFWKIRK